MSADGIKFQMIKKTSTENWNKLTNLIEVKRKLGGHSVNHLQKKLPVLLETIEELMTQLLSGLKVPTKNSEISHKI